MKYIKTKIINTVHEKYQTPAYFGTGMTSAGSFLKQRNTSPTFQLRY
jgi:hypothetical protein